MNTVWENFLDEVNESIKAFEAEGCETTYFRGHSNDKFKLLPSLLRYHSKDLGYLEQALFYDFVSMAGAKIKGDSSWDILFTMRHYGVPTRLLDWTTSFANALYFAITDKSLKKPHIWLLNPFALSEMNTDFSIGLLNPNYDFDNDYVKLFVNIEEHPDILRPEYPIPLYPARNNPRVFAQQGVFTIHGSKIGPLETLAPDFVRKIYIPLECLKEAHNFLILAGIHEYSIYPDFTGLSNHLKTKYKL